MFDFILSILLLIICVIIGNLLAFFISNYFLSKSLKKSIFSKSDFTDIDDDFFSDDSKSSITDINTDSLVDSSDDSPIIVDSSDDSPIDIDNKYKPKFF